MAIILLKRTRRLLIAVFSEVLSSHEIILPRWGLNTVFTDEFHNGAVAAVAGVRREE